MARAHKQADVLTAKRKRVKRAIASLKKSITDDMPASEARFRRSYIAKLEGDLKKTYVGRVRDKGARTEMYRRANEEADRLTRRVAAVRGGRGTARERRRSTEIFRQEMRAASQGRPSALGEMGREKVKIFYRYTQRVWDRPNVPPEKRLDVIMKAYGADTLSALFDRIMERNAKALEYARAMSAHEGDLEDYMDTDGGSPVWLIAVTPDVIR